MPYTLPFQNGNKTRLNRMERQFIYSAFTLPIELQPLANEYIVRQNGILLCHSDIIEGQYKYDDTKYNIIWLDFPEKCISNMIDFSIRDFTAFGIPPLILIRKHKA